MRSFLRKLRGALSIAVTWGGVWAAIFAAIAFVIGIVDPDSIDAGEGPVRIAGIGAMFGFISGAVFAALFTATEGRKTLRDLSLGRAALWGAVATAAFPLLTPVANSMLIIFCPVGAALGAGFVAVAKRGELTGAPEQPKLR